MTQDHPRRNTLESKTARDRRQQRRREEAEAIKGQYAKPRRKPSLPPMPWDKKPDVTD